MRWFTLLIVGCVSVQAAGAVINVPGDQPTIQAAIGVAVNGDEIIVAPGTYVENINFLGKAITLRSTDPGDPNIVISTIIDGNGLGSVVICTTNEGPDTVLSGFVLTGGNAPDGGGMFNDFSSPTVTNCTFTGNSATNIFGGGGGMSNNESNPTVSNCAFIENSALNGGGGGMWNDDSNPILTNCIFSGNASNWGGGMFNFMSAPTVSNCTFSNNTTTAFGGGMVNNFGNPQVLNCTFLGNTSATNGGGMHNDTSSSPLVTGCTFNGNTANSGGGVFNQAINPTLTDTIVCGNDPDQVSGAFTNGGGNTINQFCPPPSTPCPPDTNGDGNVNVTDLLALLAAWGACS